MKSRVFLVGFILSYGFLSGQSLHWDPNVPFTTVEITAKTQGSYNHLIIDAPVEVQGLVSLPEYLAVSVVGQGNFVIKSAQTRLAILGPLKADRKPIFNLSAPGVTTFGTNSDSNIRLPGTAVFYPEWWGLMPNLRPSQDDSKATNALNYKLTKEIMLDMASSGGGHLSFGEGIYYIRDIVIDSDNITVSGQGRKTVLKFDRWNYKTSTRRGGIFTIQGPTAEKYVVAALKDPVSITGNKVFTKNRTIENIVVRDLSIEWETLAAVEDPAMNGLTVVNAQNVLIDNVHVNLFGANRAFYVASLFDGDKTQNVTIQNSSCQQSRTGVFILHGFENNEFRRSQKVLDNIKILNNKFDVVPMGRINVKNFHLNLAYLDPFSTGVYFAGSEYTESYQNGGIVYEHLVGSFLIEGNEFNNADFGVRSLLPSRKPFKNYIHQVKIADNTFRNYKYTGIYTTFKEIEITGNKFLVDQLVELPEDISTKENKGYKATGITIAKAPWPIFHSYHGPEKATINNNVFSGCFLGARPIDLTMNDRATAYITNNTVMYDSSCQLPNFDLKVNIDRDQFNNKRATIVLENNIETNKNRTKNKPWNIWQNARRKRLIELVTPAGEKYEQGN